MIQQIFEELKTEARVGEVKLTEDEETRILRILFNIVEENTYDDIPNLYIKNKISFNKTLKEYVNCSLKFYNLPETKYNIKLILSYLFVNITNNEMNDIESYISKYINFMKDSLLSFQTGEKSTELGDLKYNVTKQSLMQETPFCFKSYFEKSGSKYALPRISFGINNGECYIYAIQNKDSKINEDPKYNKEVKEKFRTINSGVSKYRNVTPSFVVALSLFISFLKENNITKVNVMTPLPIRQNNRDMCLDFKIKFKSMYGNLDSKDLEKFKQEIEEKKLNDDYNSTIKFVNCFNRLKIHFDNLFFKELDEVIVVEIINLISNNNFLNDVVKEKER